MNIFTEKKKLIEEIERLRARNEALISMNMGLIYKNKELLRIVRSLYENKKLLEKLNEFGLEIIGDLYKTIKAGEECE